MLNFKNYIDIENFTVKYADAFSVGDNIVITEKVDGSCSSYQYNKETGQLEPFSRRLPLTSTNTLNGFYEYVNRLEASIYENYSDFRFFGEWHLKHLVQYIPDEINKFHCFDVYDTINGNWLPWEKVKIFCRGLNIETVPIFYEGPFISWEHIESFIGKTQIGITTGEGIVITNQSNLNNPDSRKPFKVKLVASSYRERSQHAPKIPLNPDELAKRQYMQDLAATIATPQRIEKCLYKMITEDNLIPDDWDSNNMPSIAKELPRKVYNDCVKEENETVIKIDNFGKICASLTMQEVRKLLEKRNGI